MQIKESNGYRVLRRQYHKLKGYRALRKLFYLGARKYCPVCQSHIRSFAPHPHDPLRTYDSLCPVCACKSPHRRNFLLMENFIASSTTSIRFLHIAPEPSIKARLSRLPQVDYVSGDLRFGVGKLQFDICALPFADQTFDFIYCCHVLNALRNDGPALNELFRVLKEGGVALLEHPVNWDGMTLEPLTAAERRDCFQDDAIFRLYGKDLRHRLEAAGFSVTLEVIAVAECNFERMDLYIPHNLLCHR